MSKDTIDKAGQGRPVHTETEQVPPKEPAAAPAKKAAGSKKAAPTKTAVAEAKKAAPTKTAVAEAKKAAPKKTAAAEAKKAAPKKTAAASKMAAAPKTETAKTKNAPAARGQAKPKTPPPAEVRVTPQAAVFGEVQAQGAGDTPMRVLFVSSEAAPFAKTGGLADVAGTLPVALAKLGHDVRVMLPKYRDISDYWKERMEYLTHFEVSMGWRKQYCGIECIRHDGVTFYFVDNEFYFARESIYGDGKEEGERFGFFCRAVLDSLPNIDFFPDILHCNDWQTGLVPVLLKVQYMHLEPYAHIRTLFTIHNLKFQGVFAYQQIEELFGLGLRYFSPEYLEFYGDVSFLKGGLVFSERISTVSPTYAREIQSPYYGERLDGLLRKRADALCGILNGIDYDVWNPATDMHLESHYSSEDMRGKAACKAALQRALQLPQEKDAMLICMVSRLTEQKGLALLEHVLGEMMQLPIQLVVVGRGEPHFHEMLTWAQWRYQDKVAVRFEYNEWLAHNVYAGSDVFLMPSRFEPCGISQLISMRYGTVPLVRETGGLSDTVEPYNKYTDEGTGFCFSNYNAHEMLYTIQQACKYFADHKLWSRLRLRGMQAQFDWAQSARQYEALYQDMRGK